MGRAQRAEGPAPRRAARRAAPRRTTTPTGIHRLRRPAARDGGDAAARVETRAGPPPGAAYDVADGATLGRGDVEIVLEDPFASSRHARIERQGGVIVLEDLGSTNGTYLNEELLRGPQPLHAGDRIRIGDSEFTFEADVASRTDAARRREFHGSDNGPPAPGQRGPLYARAPLFAVADGMGGAQAGEVASRIAVETLGGRAAATARRRGRSAASSSGANERIHELSREDEHRAGMGTTMTAASSARTRSRSRTSATRAPTCCATAS